jgi:hypothetical protein
MVYWRGGQPPSADEASDETVRFILGLDGVEIDIWELQRLAKSEAGTRS